MILPQNPRVLIATKPVDFRKGMDGLVAIVAAELKLEPFSGIVYVFRSKRADRVKLLFWDGTGVCLVTKRLEGGKFRWPKLENGVIAPFVAYAPYARFCSVASGVESARRKPVTAFSGSAP